MNQGKSQNDLGDKESSKVIRSYPVLNVISISIHWIGYFLIIMALMLLISNYFTGADNLWQAIITALAGVYFGLFQPSDGWKSRSLILVGFIYLIFLILEYFILGLPDPLFMDVKVHNGMGGFSIPGLLNYYSPWIYFSLKIITAIIFWILIRRVGPKSIGLDI